MILSFVFIALAIACYSISQLQQHGKLKWTLSGEPFSFWGKESHVRKYKDYSREKGDAFFLSTTILVFLTDGYHLCQALFLLFVSLSVAFAIGFNWWVFLLVYSLTHAVHFITYKLLSK